MKNLELIEALQERNAYLENELKQAKQLFQELINEWEVIEPTTVEPNILDNMFNNPMDQLNKLL
jgi:hypothetical protein